MKHSLSGDTTGVLYTERRIFDLDRNIVKELYPDVGRFTTFIGKLSSLPTNDPDYKMFEHRSVWPDMKFYVGGTGTWTNSGTVWSISNLTVELSAGGSDDIGYAVDGLILEFRDAVTDVVNGVAVITNVDTQQQIDVKAIRKGATAGDAGLADLADGDVAYVIGNAHEEGSGSPEAWADELVVVWNSAQIMKSPVEITGTLYEMALRGYSNELARLRREKAMEHKMLKNAYFLKGVRNNNLSAPDHQVGANNRQLRTTMGIIPALSILGTSDNKFSNSYASYSYDNFVDDTEKIFARTNERGVKYGFGGPKVISFYAKTGTSGFLGNSNATLNVANGQSRFGFPIKVIESPHGDLVITKDIALKGPYTSTLVVIDPKNIGHRIYRNPKYETAIQLPDVDGIKDQYKSDEGLDITLIETHSLVEFS